MPKTEFLYFKGKVKWFRPVVPDERFGDPVWKHVLYPDSESLAKIRELINAGLMNHLKQDEDGHYITIKRKTTRKTKDRKLVGNTPPEIVDNNGQPIRDIPIGNGSDVTTKVRCYWFEKRGTGKQAPAIEWTSSRIDNLVPFNRTTDYFPEEAEKVSGLAEQPAPLF